MAITFRGTSSYTLVRDEPGTDAVLELPIRTMTYRGRFDQLATFIASVPLGSSHGGGFIIRRRPVDQGPYAEVDLTIALAPNASIGAVKIQNSTGIKTASKSAEVTASNVIPGQSTVNATRDITYYSPQTAYLYWSHTQPTAARFSTVAGGISARIIRSRITATAGGKSVPYGGSAPAALVSALAMSVIDRVVSHEAEQIEGTPWYRCTDVIAKEYQGDT